MQPAEDYLKETTLALSNQFEMDVPGELKGVQNRVQFEALKKLLAQKLAEMIDHEFDKFLNILYRIDVDEQKVKKTLAEYPINEALDSIAEMIIQRQLKKIITRKQYSSGGNDLQFDV